MQNEQAANDKSGQVPVGEPHKTFGGRTTLTNSSSVKEPSESPSMNGKVFAPTLFEQDESPVSSSNSDEEEFLSTLSSSKLIPEFEDQRVLVFSVEILSNAPDSKINDLVNDFKAIINLQYGEGTHVWFRGVE